MTFDRRAILRRGLLGAILLGAIGLAPAAPALEPEAARSHVRQTTDEVLRLVRSDASTQQKAQRFRDILEKRAAMPQIARFAAGVAWRDMGEDQQERFVDAFTHYVSAVYARRFQEYSGQTLTVNGVEDEGRRGLIVESTVSQPNGQPVKVNWRVSDRPGRVVIADIIIEGVSLLVTQREEIAAMLDKRGGSMDRLIADLAAT